MHKCINITSRVTFKWMAGSVAVKKTEVGTFFNAEEGVFKMTIRLS